MTLPSDKFIIAHNLALRNLIQIRKGSFYFDEGGVEVALSLTFTRDKSKKKKRLIQNKK